MYSDGYILRWLYTQMSCLNAVCDVVAAVAVMLKTSCALRNRCRRRRPVDKR